MTHLTLKMAAIIASSLMIFTLAQAESRAEKRAARQEKRIEQGQQSGALTDQEAKHLEHQQERIDAAADKAAADGEVTKKEKVHLEKMQDRASKKIHHSKHNKRRGG